MVTWFNGKPGEYISLVPWAQELKEKLVTDLVACEASTFSWKLRHRTGWDYLN